MLQSADVTAIAEEVPYKLIQMILLPISASNNVAMDIGEQEACTYNSLADKAYTSSVDSGVLFTSIKGNLYIFDSRSSLRFCTSVASVLLRIRAHCIWHSAARLDLHATIGDICFFDRFY